MKMQFVEKAASMSHLEEVMRSLEREACVSECDIGRACLRAAGTKRGGQRSLGPSDDFASLALATGCPGPDELRGFETAVRTCPLELVQAMLWEAQSTGPGDRDRAARCRALAIFTLAHRLRAHVQGQLLLSPEFDAAVEMVAGDLCREFMRPRSDRPRLADLEAGAVVLRSLEEILMRLATEHEPHYLADSFQLPPLYGYNVFRKKLLEFEVRKAHGRLFAPIAELKRQWEGGLANRETDYSDRTTFVAPQESPFMSAAAGNQLRGHDVLDADLVKIRRAAGRFFAAQSLEAQQILLLTSLAVGNDDDIGALLNLRRETVSRKRSIIRDGWLTAARRAVGPGTKGMARKQIEDWSAWAEVVPVAQWPQLPDVARGHAARALARGFEYVQRFMAEGRDHGAGEAILMSQLRPVTGLIAASLRRQVEALRASISAFKADLVGELSSTTAGRRAGDLSEETRHGWLNLDTEFLHILGGFSALGFDRAHVHAAVRVAAALEESERWLLVHAGDPEAEKRHHLGGESGLAEVLASLARKRTVIEAALFPSTSSESVWEEAPDGTTYLLLRENTIGAEAWQTDRERTFDVLVTLAGEGWRPY